MLSDLRKLRHVVAVAQAESFTGAASALAITQSALTKSIADVESQLGVKIFYRLPRGVALTDSGQAFVARASQILIDAEELMAMATAHRNLESGCLRIGVLPAAFRSLLAPLVGKFAGRYPGLRLEVSDGPFDPMVQTLMSGNVELLLGPTSFFYTRTDLSIIAVTKMRYSFIARRGHPAASEHRLTGGGLLEYPFVLPATNSVFAVYISQVLQQLGLSNVVHQYVCDYFPMVLEIIKRTNAISPVLSVGALGARLRQQFHVFEGVLDLPAQDMGIAVPRARELSLSAQAFVEVFAQHFSSSED